MNEKILVVDDVINNVRLLKDILEDESFSVVTADNGHLALDLVKTNKPDVILLDIMMPNMDGFEVCRNLKNEMDLKDIPVIMVTAKTDSQDLKKALEIGAFDYIKKPIDEVEVVARVQSALRFKKHQDKLNELASKDSLTGIYNHALLVELYGKELKKQERNGHMVSFVMLDIDFFKNVNDTYGHVSGDIILKELSTILVNSIRSSDIVGRYGGEEFSIVFPDTNAETAYQLCERIREAVEKHDFNIGNQNINITISMGVYCKDSKESMSSKDAIQKADEALYFAKRNGRNKVHLYG